jgi:NADH dehydrogenase FAD-containing subunit
MGAASASKQTQKKRLLVVGASFAGIYMAQNSWDHWQVTLLDKTSYFEVLTNYFKEYVEDNYIDRLQTDYTEFIRTAPQKDVKMVLGKLTNVNANNSVAYEAPDGSQATLEYDAICLCTGSSQPYPHKDFDSQTKAERNAKLQEEVKKARAAKSILIVGGGIVGVEIAAEFAEKQTG